jgi:hypothetical protein
MNFICKTFFLPIKIIYNTLLKDEGSLFHCIDKIIDIVDQILEKKKKDSSADVSAFEEKLDTMVAELYGVTTDGTVTMKALSAYDGWTLALR